MSLDVHEFPERLGAITVRELRAGLLGRDMVWLLVGVQLVLALAGIYAVQTSITSSRDALSIMEFAVWAGTSIGLAILSPLRALRALHADRDSRLLELLQLSSLSAGRIVLGKWISLAVQTALFLVSLLPFFALRYFLGGADLIGDAQVLLIFFAVSLLLQAAFLLVSTFPIFLRGLALAGVVLVLFGTIPMGLGMGHGPFGSMSRAFGGLGKDGVWVAVFLAAQLVCGIGICLTLAAQMIAAPSENYAGRTRLWVGAWAVCLVCLIQIPRDHPKWGDIAIVALAGIGIASLFELSAERQFLPAQLPRWALRFRGGPVLALPLLPGWHSALLFYAPLAIALLFVGYLGNGSLNALLLAPQAMALALLPRAILEAVRWHWFGKRQLAIFALHAGFGVLAIGVGAACSSVSGKPIWPQFFPPLGFWNGLAWVGPEWSPVSGLVWSVFLLAFVLIVALCALEPALKAARKLRS
jgi:hypothetical protein